ncbi:DUF262 domain-containing protein [Arthrobacter sp. AK04]|uniref:GmrSD restriction endonuclease domain-containing protein n=1 Tax=Arthrobacter sp. AK04 TaxID=2900048 RepID=UPI001E4E0188|nr:DUF262 domain-containing protein [Arthrobacter sp. AK04]MCD5341508.1 DUF262 domain-containing protein [Arthrobacter sp. AK04]
MTAAIVTAKDPKPTSERIQQLAVRVLMGDIVLPEFQRPYVWKRRQILELLDSILRNYPIGSMLLWESKQALTSKRSIADLEVAERSENYPVNYLLDGQQRLSTVCGVLNWQHTEAKSIWNVIYDLKTEKFSHIDHLDEVPIHQIPLSRLSDPASFYRRLAPLEDQTLSHRADVLFNRFKDYQVPLVTLGDMSIRDVAPVFERINSTGTRLTIFDLMRAATWSPDFDLGKTVDDLRAAIEPKKFHGLDAKTFLRALAAAGGNDFSAESIDGLRNLKTAELTAAAEATKKAALRAADFLSTEVGAPTSEALPYSNQFAFLCEVFRRVPEPNHHQLEAILRWFWKSTLGNYFAGWNTAQMSADSKIIKAWADGSQSEIEVRVLIPSQMIWEKKAFRSNSAVSKMIGIMLGHAQPRDIVTGQAIDVGKSLAWSNDKEYHHFFPQQYLARQGVGASGSNLVANIVLLTSKSNISIRDTAPSEYLQKIIDHSGRDALVARLRTNLVPEDALDAALKDDYEGFLKCRGAFLHAEALKLTGEENGQVVSSSQALEATEDSPDFEEDLDVDPTE